MKKLYKIIPYFLLTIFITISISLYLQNLNLKREVLEINAIPYVELNNYLSFNNEGIANGSLTGFVKFDNIEDQPRDLKQYVTIYATDIFDDNLGQIFTIVDTIVMDYAGPQVFDPVPVYIKSIENNIVTLSDTADNLYVLDNNSKTVYMFDNTGDSSTLITEQIDYRKFMNKLLTN